MQKKGKSRKEENINFFTQKIMTMQITIRNNAGLPKRYLRFIKWRMNRIKDKFQHLIYAEVFINSEGQSPKIYSTTIRLGIAGHDIILQNKSENLGELFQKSMQAVHRYLEKNKSPKTKRRNKIFYKELD